MKICIIVLQYDQGLSWKDTIECVKSIDKSDFIDVLIVDNASPGGVDQIISSLSLCPSPKGESYIYKKDNIHLILLDNNYGYAGGNNRGFALSKELDDYDYVWFMNNDVIVRPGSISSLLEFLEYNTDYDSIGTTVLDHGSNIIQCAGGATYIPLLAAGRPILGGKNVSELCSQALSLPEPDYYTGCSFIFRTSIFDKVHGFSEDYFLYFEEIDIYTRLKSLKGFKKIYLKNVIVEHKDGASINYAGRSKLSERQSTLSSLIFTSKYYGRILIPVLFIRSFYKSVIYALSLRFDLIRTHFQAVSDFIRGKI